MSERAFKNTVLKNLKSDSIKRLQLRPVKLERAHEIERPGDEIENLYFIEEGLGSMTTMFKDGFQVEVSLFGNEAVIGTAALIGTKRSLNNIYMQVPGHGFTCTVDAAAREFRVSQRFRDIVLRYVQAQLVQTALSYSVLRAKPLRPIFFFPSSFFRSGRNAPRASYRHYFPIQSLCPSVSLRSS